jgi:flavin reductase (DIM6/NTAB) family NADH-FMN oxidoreductase RutF
MSTDKIKEALEQIQYHVAVVTVGVGGVENGLTASWFSQASFEPPQLVFSIAKTHYSTELLSDHACFVVNLLSDQQKDVATHFAKQSLLGEDKIDKFPTRPAQSEVPVLTDSLAYFDCQVTATFEAGDHLLVLGEIKDAEVLRQGTPLGSESGLRYRG